MRSGKKTPSRPRLVLLKQSSESQALVQVSVGGLERVQDQVELLSVDDGPASVRPLVGLFHAHVGLPLSGADLKLRWCSKN